MSGRIVEHASNGRAIPGRFAGSCPLLCSLQATTNLADGAAISSDPLKHLANDPCLLPYNLEAGFPGPFLFGGRAIAIRSSPQHTHLANLRSMPFATPTPLENFRALILGDHTLDLEEELIFRRLPDFAVEKDYLDPCSQELF